MIDYKGQVLENAQSFLEPWGYGCKQGNRGGVTFCVLINTPLLQALCAEGFGTNFNGALSNQQVVFVAYTFVDDTDLIE